ncbi:unnamed protein product, partial [Staurois parvus]
EARTILQSEKNKKRTNLAHYLSNQNLLVKEWYSQTANKNRHVSPPRDFRDKRPARIPSWG